MNEQKKNKGIDWLVFPDGTKGYTFNPVTGCRNKCSYCYSKPIAERFGHNSIHEGLMFSEIPKLYGIDEPLTYDDKNGKTRVDPYPALFTPTFHRYRLDEPQEIKQPSKIFVCSMGELFGDYIPDEWIEQVFDACRKAPQHTYLFLTKNPKRYVKLRLPGLLGSLETCGQWWFGSTITKQDDPFLLDSSGHLNINRYLSVEPILGKITNDTLFITEAVLQNHWLIFGAMTKNGRNVKIYEPQWEWIKDLVVEARKRGIPIFMKQSMKGIVPEGQFTQEYPKEMR